MAIIEPSIQPFIARQFPSIYRDEDQNFIAFMRTYYEWLEQQGKPLYYARNFLELQDVDATSDEILIFIKEKFLKNIQFSTEANIKTIIKHCLDIYRSKGTQRCIDLLFRLVFNEVVGFYYPKDDLFSLSDGIWRIPQYLELSMSPNNIILYQKVIKGTESQATAFVDDVIRRTIKGKILDIAYISSISGIFQTNEMIIPIDGSLTTTQCPIIIGSLSNITLPEIGTGQGYEVGDRVKIHSDYGEQGEALVTSVITQPSVILASANDGGYGYTATANVIVSKMTMTLSNVNITNSYARCYAYPLETATQGSNTGTIVGFSDVSLYVNNLNGSFIKGEKVIQHNKLWTYDKAIIGEAIIKSVPSDTQLMVVNVHGVFYRNSNIIGETSGTTANITSVSMYLGITDLVGEFQNNAVITTPCINATTSYIGTLNNSDFEVANNLSYIELVDINTDRLSNWTANLNAATYGNNFVNASANVSQPFNTFLSWANDVPIGKINELIPVNVNFQIDYPPMVLIAEPYVKDMNIRDKVLFFTGATASFMPGEVVSQSGTGARGIIQNNSNTTVLHVQEMRFYANQFFTITSNTATKIIGDRTGTTANVTAVSEQGDILPTGENADIWSRAAAFEGSVTGLTILDAGFGHIDNELIWFNFGDDQDSNTGYGYTALGTNGKNEGFYEQKGGFLSDQKKLFDGYYYQNYSYEIISSKTIDKYQDMMDKIGHVAGTKMFSRYVYAKNINSVSIAESMEITIT